MIRPATGDDAGAIAAIYAPFVEETAVSFEEQAPSVREIGRRIAASHSWLVATLAERTIGYAYAAPFHPRPAYRWSCEVSVYLAEQGRGRGIGRRLLGELLVELRERGFVNVFAGIALPNVASVKLFESSGFEQIALQRDVGFKLGRWHDVGWWQLHLRNAPVPPPDVR